MKGRAEQRLGLLEADSWLQPTHDLDPIEVIVQVAAAGAGAEDHSCVQRNVDVGNCAWLGSEERGRGDTTHVERLVVEADRLSDRSVRRAEPAAADSLAEDGDGAPARSVVLRLNQ